LGKKNKRKIRWQVFSVHNARPMECEGTKRCQAVGVSEGGEGIFGRECSPIRSGEKPTSPGKRAVLVGRKGMRPGSMEKNEKLVEKARGGVRGVE